ncbi:MAG: response regulator [Treponema sp.]|nr:response regulator [Treponema sp.]
MDMLLVEDNENIQKINKRMLEKYGKFNLRLAMNLAEVQEQIAQTAPDVIVLDIMLPLHPHRYIS